eukprot:g1523.t1
MPSCTGLCGLLAIRATQLGSKLASAKAALRSAEALGAQQSEIAILNKTLVVAESNLVITQRSMALYKESGEVPMTPPLYAVMAPLSKKLQIDFTKLRLNSTTFTRTAEECASAKQKATLDRIAMLVNRMYSDRDKTCIPRSDDTHPTTPQTGKPDEYIYGRWYLTKTERTPGGHKKSGAKSSIANTYMGSSTDYFRFQEYDPADKDTTTDPELLKLHDYAEFCAKHWGRYHWNRAGVTAIFTWDGRYTGIRDCSLTYVRWAITGRRFEPAGVMRPTGAPHAPDSTWTIGLQGSRYTAAAWKTVKYGGAASGFAIRTISPNADADASGVQASANHCAKFYRPLGALALYTLEGELALADLCYPGRLDKVGIVQTGYLPTGASTTAQSGECWVGYSGPCRAGVHKSDGRVHDVDAIGGAVGDWMANRHYWPRCMDLAATLAKDCYTPQHPGNVTTVWARWGGTKHGIWTADVAPYSRWSDGFKEVDHTTPLTLGKWNTVANSPGNTCNGMPTKNLCTSVSQFAKPYRAQAFRLVHHGDARPVGNWYRVTEMEALDANGIRISAAGAVTDNYHHHWRSSNVAPELFDSDLAWGNDKGVHFHNNAIVWFSKEVNISALKMVQDKLEGGNHNWTWQVFGGAFVPPVPVDGDGTCAQVKKLDLTQAPVAQSSNGAQSYGARHVVDGVGFGATWAECGHFTDSSSPWFRVDLGRDISVEKIRLYNRQDCCHDRLKEVSVYLGDSDSSFGANMLVAGSGTARSFIDVPRDTALDVNIGGARGRYLYVARPGQK